MRITPIEIQQQQFKGKMLGGLDPNDVDAFLQTVAQEFEELIRENNELKEKVSKANATVADLESREVQLRETLLAAHRVTEEMKHNAQKEAQLVVSEAELKGERIVAEAEHSLLTLKSQIQELKREKSQFESGFKSLLDTYSKLLTIDE